MSVKESVHHVHELSTEDEERFSDLFNKLDMNKDGRIDIEDLTHGLKKLGVHQMPGQAQILMRKGDKDQDGEMDFAEFAQYLMEHEKQLKLQFKHLDRNEDGHVETAEVFHALKNLGVNVTEAQVDRIIKSMDKDGSLKVDWMEWREYLLLHPSSELKDIYTYWRHATYLDIGEDVIVPDDFTEQEYTSGMWWRQLVAGGAAGAVSRTCTAPLDRLKVLLQVHASKKNDLGIITGFRHMLQEGGVKSLWRGNGINVVKIAPETAIKFMAYEQMKRIFHTPGTELKMHERFVSGSLAGAIAQSTIYPMEVLKTRLALRKTGQYSGIGDCARKILKTEGLLSFYRGYIPNILGILPYAGIDLAVYETLKIRWIHDHPSQSDPGVLVLLLCGTASSTCGQIASYPLALVRTRLQAQISNATMLGLFKTILKEEGIQGLYRGIMPNFMKVAPAVSISYVVYEHVRKSLGVNWGTK
ncbi:calcium-binding mitochondrial carrier protein SCaMC-2-like [Glandiceps talaboti]